MGKNLELMKDRSPITYVNNVRSPICIIHSQNDSRTPLIPVLRYIQKLQENKKTFYLHVIPNLGHTIYRKDDAVDILLRALIFLKKMLEWFFSSIFPYYVVEVLWFHLFSPETPPLRTGSLQENVKIRMSRNNTLFFIYFINVLCFPSARFSSSQLTLSSSFVEFHLFVENILCLFVIIMNLLISSILITIYFFWLPRFSRLKLL